MPACPYRGGPLWGITEGRSYVALLAFKTTLTALASFSVRQRRQKSRPDGRLILWPGYNSLYLY